MSFASLQFPVFLLLVFIAHWCLSGRPRSQNLVLLAASYLFYACWDWRFLSLLVLSTVTDYLVGLALDKAKSGARRRRLLGLSVSVNLGLLGVFKYFDFFLESWRSVVGAGDAGMRAWSLVLPVGISFYTLQTLSYTIDVYREQIEPTRDPLAFAVFVSFFPQLVAGPIERAGHTLVQFERVREFSYPRAADGIRQMAWGFFKKLVVADHCALYVDAIFRDPGSHSSSVLILGAVLFGVQIYGDFGGYSDIAIGCAKLFGIELRRNFWTPYFANSLRDFWRRWHISLSTWFRDYLYIPLGGSRATRVQQARNLMLVFLLSGLWHGAEWTFVLWGAVHGLLMVVGVALAGRIPVSRWLGTVVTFSLVSLTWVLFRAPTLQEAASYYGSMLVPPYWSAQYWEVLPCLLGFFALEWRARTHEHPFQVPMPVKLRGALQVLLVLVVVNLGVRKPVDFLYFQF